MAVKLSCGKEGEKISEYDRETVNRIAEEYKLKIGRFLDEIVSFDVHLKCHQKEGNIKRYVVEVKIISPKHIFESSSDEYNLRDAATHAMKKILNEIEHKTYASDKHGVGVRKK